MAQAVAQTGAPSTSGTETAERRKKGFLRVFIERNKVGMIGYAIFLAIVLIAFIGPLFLPEDNPTNVSVIYQPPSWDYPLGTDFSGKDVLFMVVTTCWRTSSTAGSTRVFAPEMESSHGPGRCANRRPVNFRD